MWLTLRSAAHHETVMALMPAGRPADGKLQDSDTSEKLSRISCRTPVSELRGRLERVETRDLSWVAFFTAEMAIDHCGQVPFPPVFEYLGIDVRRKAGWE